MLGNVAFHLENRAFIFISHNRKLIAIINVLDSYDNVEIQIQNYSALPTTKLPVLAGTAVYYMLPLQYKKRSFTTSYLTAPATYS